MSDLSNKLSDINLQLTVLNDNQAALLTVLEKIRSLMFVVATMMVSVAMSFIWHIIAD
jgi:hypothetical protein